MTGSGPASVEKGFSIRLAKVEASIEEGRHALLGYLQPFDLGDKVINRIEVVLEELVSNVVRHAEVATGMELSAFRCDEGVCLCVEDDGAEFNPLEREEQKPFESLDDAQPGGLGIPLIRRLSHSVSYERTGGRNRVSAVIAA